MPTPRKRSAPKKAKNARKNKENMPKVIAFGFPKNREEWLETAVSLILPFVRQAASWAGVSSVLTAPPKVSCSWLPGRATKALSGSTFNESAGTYEITISPIIGKGWDDNYSELAIAHLVHELVHCVVGLDCGHRGDFVAVAKMVGLAAPYAHAGLSADLLPQMREQVIDRLGPYPHTSVERPQRVAGSAGGNRQRKWVCSHCGRIVRCAGDLDALHLCADGTQARFVEG